MQVWKAPDKPLQIIIKPTFSPRLPKYACKWHVPLQGTACCRTCTCSGRCPILPTGPFTADTTQPLSTYLLLLERPEQLGGPQIKCVLLDLPGQFWRVEMITSWLEQIRELSLSVVQARFIKQDISLVFRETLLLLVRENYLGLHPSTFGMAVFNYTQESAGCQGRRHMPCFQPLVSLAVVLAALPLLWVLKVSDVQCLVLQTGLVNRLINAEHSRISISHTVRVN